MGKNVFANGREISAKADDNKSIAAMPDICLSPPSPPAGPIPIPYPNFSDASKTSSGSKKVKIGNKEVGLKNKSVYKSSKGDEAATRSFGMGVVTHKISGATKHAAWSFDVKVEGQNVIRFLDITTHNHGSDPNNLALTVDAAKLKIAAGKPLNCTELDALNQDARDNDLRPSAAKLDKKGVAQRGFTTTTSSFTKGKTSTFSKAGSRGGGIRSGSRKDFAAARPKGDCMACGGDEWGNAGHNNHTEPKLIGEILDKTPGPASPGGLGTLTMSIHWQEKGKKGGRKEPCGRCKKGICKAVECGLAIKLCNDKGEAEKPPCKKGKWVEVD